MRGMRGGMVRTTPTTDPTVKAITHAQMETSSVQAVPDRSFSCTIA